jgi:hypothetical protein
MSIWFQDPANFLKNYSDFFPTKDQSLNEQLNSLLRLAIYFSIIVFIIKHDTNIFFVPIFIAGFTYFLYVVDTQNKTMEKLSLDEKNLKKNTHTNQVCTKPVENNPFMNVLMNEYTEQPKREQACDITNNNIKSKATQFFEENLYRDVDDIFAKNASDRNFYTMPSTTIPNDREAFLKFCYPQSKTCKEDGTSCYKNLYRSVNN